MLIAEEIQPPNRPPGLVPDGSLDNEECVIARRGERHGWAGKFLKLTDRYALLSRAGDGRRMFLMNPRTLVAYLIRACSKGEAAAIGTWQRRGLPGVTVAGRGSVRAGDPRTFEEATSADR